MPKKLFGYGGCSESDMMTAAELRKHVEDIKFDVRRKKTPLKRPPVISPVPPNRKEKTDEISEENT